MATPSDTPTRRYGSTGTSPAASASVGDSVMDVDVASHSSSTTSIGDDHYSVTAHHNDGEPPKPEGGDCDIVEDRRLNITQVQRQRKIFIAASVVITVVTGFVGGLLDPHKNDDDSHAGNDDNDHYPFNYISSMFGWVAFAAWSLSFYPQPIMNAQRGSVVGMSFDYQLYNILGFTAYSMYNCGFYWINKVKRQYENRHDGKGNQVQLPDVFFSLHAVVLTVYILNQIARLDRGTQRFSWKAIIGVTVAFVVAIIYLIAVLADDQGSGDGGGGEFFSWLYYLYFLSGLKMGVTLVKYTPQLYMNYKRKTTVGVSIWNFAADLTGGICSLIQLVMDAWLSEDWSAITGNMAKFFLGVCTIVFDTMFLIQHYCIYTDRRDAAIRYDELEEEFAPSASENMVIQAKYGEPDMLQSDETKHIEPA